MGCARAIAAFAFLTFAVHPAFAAPVISGSSAESPQTPAADEPPRAPAAAPAPTQHGGAPASEPPQPVPAAMASPRPLRPICPVHLAPVYVASWPRLEALTQSDALIFPQVESLARRQDAARTLAVGGVAVGGIATLVGTFHALGQDSWSRFDKWSVASGGILAATTLFLAWAIEPDRDELYTLINQWNLRHPQQELAP